MKIYVKPDHKEIKRLMYRKGLNTYEVANRTKGTVTQPTVSRLTTGKMEKAQHAKIETLARVLGIPMEDLLAD